MSVPRYAMLFSVLQLTLERRSRAVLGYLLDGAWSNPKMIAGRMAFFEPVSPGIKDVVTTLYRRDQQGVLGAVGAAFLLSYRARAGSGFFNLIVMSRHVVTDSDSKFCLDLHVRENRIGDGSTLMLLQATHPESMVFLHRDPMVNPCVLPRHFHAAEAEVKTLHPEFLAQQHEL